VAVDPLEKFGEVVSCEGPVERPSRLFVAVLELQQLLLQISERCEVVRREELALDDREVDLDLVEPAGVHGSMDQDDGRPFGLQPTDRALTAMGRAVINDPEHPAGLAVGLLAHDLIDEAVERSAAGLGFAAPEQLGAMDVPGCQIGPGASPFVFMLDVDRMARPRRQRGMLASARLDAGLLVGAQDIVVWSEGKSLPTALIEIEDAAGLGGEPGIAREDPTAMAPRAQGILTEPAPQGRAADLSHQPLGHHLLAQIADRPTGQRQAVLRRQFTGQRLDLDDDAGGKSGPGARCAAGPPIREGGGDRTASAICSRSGAPYRGAQR